MAYAAVASLSQTIHLILDYHKRSVSPEFEDQITSLDKHIIFLRSFLEDCPDEADSWEDIICEVTNLAEDIIELLMSDSLLQSTVISSKSKFGTRSYEVCHDFDELERVIEEIESIAKGVKERHKEAVEDSNDDLTQIISELCDEFSWQKIIAIVGRGGVGKTTLARNVFNHPAVVELFQIRAWATVTEDFSLRGVLSSLLRSMNVSNAGKLFESEDELSISIKRILWRKRYLIVLDDVYYVSDFLRIFPVDYTSRIILTTRSQSVATEYFISYIHKMNAMNFDQSWNLFQKNIFKGNRCPPRLEYMGKMITKSCRGLHLMIAVVSGILAVDQTEAAWEDIAENLKTSINFGDHEHSLHILYLSHRQLPHHLRPILLYLGIFQKGREIRFSKLIKLWMAEGFLNEGGSYKCLEDMCEEYVEDLVRRSLVVVGKRKSDGRIKSFSIHDLVREMCIKQAKVDNFFHVSVEATKMNERRVSIHDCDLDLLKNVCGSTIRTIICLEGNHQVLQQSLGYFRLLRILDLSNVYDFLEEYDFPGQVFELFHLRHLAFGYPFNISEAISNLENLQTLVIHPRRRWQVVKLPVEIWKMPQLRHLVVVSCELPCQKEAMIPLENLQTLSKAVNLTCSRETLKMMPNLKKLCITFTPWRDPGEDYRLHNLIYLKELEVLKIEASNRPKLHRIRPPPFHPTLRKLSLKGLGVPWEEMKTVASLPNLQVLKLRDDACIGNTWETSEGGFSQLTFLLIDGSDLKHWITRSTHFPKLKCLLLHHCWCMSEVPHEIGEIQTLESIQVDRLNKVQLQSVKRIQQDRQSLGNDCIQIHKM